MACMFSACSNSQKMQIANVNVATNTFDFVDVKSGSVLRYSKLILNDREVVDYHCSSLAGTSNVIFFWNKDDITRNGGSVSFKGGKGITTHAKLKYTIESGVLAAYSE